MADRQSNSGPDDSAQWKRVLWPSARLGEAIHSLARCSGLPTCCTEAFAPSQALTAEQLSTWMEAAADRGGIQAQQVVASLEELGTLTLRGGPLLLRVGDDEFLAVVGSRGVWLSVLGLDERRHRMRTSSVMKRVRQPFEAPLAGEVDRLLDRMRVSGKGRARARSRILNQLLAGVRIRSCWLLRLPPGSPAADQIRETRLRPAVALLIAAHLSQYLLFVVSWWLLGRSVMNGHIDSGWLFGWILLLLSLVPFRLMATWMQGLIAATAGAALRRTLLRGALLTRSEDIRRKGAGQLFGMVVESSAIESLALTGGVTACFALLELAIAAAVLWSGSGPLLDVVLACWLGVVAISAWRYVGQRRRWTAERLAMTEQLMESMVGHRTRLAQQPVERWHPQEDSALAQYLESGRVMDRSSIWLTAVVPRGWLMLALAALAPAIVAHASPARIAISVGGSLLAYRSLRRLSGGLSNLAGAAIAAQATLPLARAAAIRENPPHPSVVVPLREDSGPAIDGPMVQARNLSFRYPLQTGQVLRECTLVIPRGARLLLEGSSGAGKTTLASILAGLEKPDSGLLLVDGLDRSVLGKAGWRQRVVMAPQAHDNYVISGSLAFNLLLGRRWPAQRADLLEAEAICRELGLGDLLDRMPGGLHQMVGETGWQLSQGERTRIFLARALLQKPELLVLDESFSALDSENVDRSIRCVLGRASSVLAIAHT